VGGKGGGRGKGGEMTQTLYAHMNKRKKLKKKKLSHHTGSKEEKERFSLRPQ
jgi:hypothetical protein